MANHEIGAFTAENAVSMSEALSELFDAIPKSKRTGYLGHLNELGIFLSNAKRAAEQQAKCPRCGAKKEKVSA